MNQAQRKFLIDKVKGKNESEIRSLKDNKKEMPSLERFILHEIMSSRVKIRTNEEILQLLTDRVLKMKKSDRLFDSGGRSWDYKEVITFQAKEFFIVPEKYEEERKQVAQHNREIDDKIAQLQQQEEMLVLRLQLATAKKLEKLISEVDDFGDLSLFDTKLKQIKE